MQYKIEIDKRAVKFISKQPKPQRERILKAIYQLPDTGDIKAMQAHEGYYRLRVGDYRIIYTVDNGELIVYVIDAGNRGQVYNDY
ncbi:MAG: type II toxin-antitoxin system RelE/ParE family toxin [Firmicutes bacterium]|nr:type II toxin-antitoxin system RelE/ParE family toxin [Bacillota bacterium]